jgi:hypothetical protein
MMHAALKPRSPRGTSSQYAGLQEDREYRVIDRGYDWVKISVNGKPLYVPKCLVTVY